MLRSQRLHEVEIKERDRDAFKTGIDTGAPRPKVKKVYGNGAISDILAATLPQTTPHAIKTRGKPATKLSKMPQQPQITLHPTISRALTGRVQISTMRF